MRTPIDLTGQTFERWLVIERADMKTTDGKTLWRCRCACGTLRSVREKSLRQGTSRSCGCWAKEQTGQRVRTHGLSHLPEYWAWHNMCRRCTRPDDPAFPLYGGRGITVCPAWQKSFVQFYGDVGPRPSPKHSIERRDNDLGYTKDNAYWALANIQNRNKRSNRLLTFQGQTLCVRDWADMLGTRHQYLYARLKKGWSVEDTLTIPIPQKQYTLITLHGITKNLRQWCTFYGQYPSTVRKRMKNGWSIEGALITPPTPAKQHGHNHGSPSKSSY